MPPTVVVHGGAGPGEAAAVHRRPEVEAALVRALHEARDVLDARGSALEAAVAAVVVLEDAPSLNAGRGSVLNALGEVEMDAAVMSGAQRRFGAVAGVRGAQNPVRVARLLHERPSGLFLAGAAADALAARHDLVCRPNGWFVTEERAREWRDRSTPASRGTVGAVVADGAGHVAAATSTGGLVGKPVGRIGDSPLVGAGTFADDASCAVSATGSGEALIRAVAAHAVAAGVSLAGLTVQEAADRVVSGVDGTAALIAVDRHGEIGLAGNTRGFFRGYARGDAEPHVALLDDEAPRPLT